ncbi:MAG: aminodeoxychorismate synthase component I [bacterium]|nr:MAG: aminodeoxychorismate synthase component I [bacterium]
MELETRLFRKTGTILLESVSVGTEDSRSYFFQDPAAIVQSSHISTVETALRQVQDRVRQGFWAAGFISYEAGGAWIPVDPPSSLNGFPLVWFALYDRHEAWEGPAILPAPAEGDKPISARLDIGKSQYVKSVNSIHRRIREGDTYQVNYTCRVRFRWDDDPLQLYLRLRRSQPVPYGAFINCGERVIVSLSPELYLARSGDRLWSRPMKGTIMRGEDPGSDQRLGEWLSEDPKNRAENLMIVDLMRNDLGRVAVTGTVEVFDPFRIQRYPRLFQMTTGVRCRLDEDVSMLDLVRASFPPGSVTGAPKVSTMKIISGLEHSPRKVYTGAMGFVSPSGDLSMSVAIRTAIVSASGWCEMGVGSGIVADSDPSREYEETLLKARFLEPPSAGEVQILDTILIGSDGRPLWLDEHLNRMALSASALRFPFAGDLALAKIRGAARAGRGKPFVMRLLLSRLGDLHAELLPLSPMPGNAIRAVVSERRTDPKDRYLYHKTTSRSLYDKELAQARRRGYDEVLFLNTEGHVTEGAITSIFLLSGEGWRTPALECGLLPGIWRARYLRDTDARESRLSLKDIQAARRVVVGNSVRGPMEVVQIMGADGCTLFAGRNSS